MPIHIRVLQVRSNIIAYQLRNKNKTSVPFLYAKHAEYSYKKDRHNLVEGVMY